MPTGPHSHCTPFTVISGWPTPAVHPAAPKLPPRSRLINNTQEPLPAIRHPIRQRRSSRVPRPGHRADSRVLSQRLGVCCGELGDVGSADEPGVWAVGSGMADDCCAWCCAVLRDVGERWGVDGSGDVVPANSVRCLYGRVECRTVADGSSRFCKIHQCHACQG